MARSALKCSQATQNGGAHEGECAGGNGQFSIWTREGAKSVCSERQASSGGGGRQSSSHRGRSQSVSGGGGRGSQSSSGRGSQSSSGRGRSQSVSGGGGGGGEDGGDAFSDRNSEEFASVRGALSSIDSVRNKTVTSFVPSGQPLSCSDLFEAGPRTTVTCGRSATEYTLIISLPVTRHASQPDYSSCGRNEFLSSRINSLRIAATQLYL
ncbi:hypothetical protein RRG08_052502 [Elysia crispata]|uniref:Uncharacterized protein n=1 Tax=Elysia crispata TaxID=231223 RepID=A0AAE0XNP0_9GAST|nr:hypothetical protein RRG08_052502 [Elysia crispata]